MYDQLQNTEHKTLYRHQRKKNSVRQNSDLSRTRNCLVINGQHTICTVMRHPLDQVCFMSELLPHCPYISGISLLFSQCCPYISVISLFSLCCPHVSTILFFFLLYCFLFCLNMNYENCASFEICHTKS